MPALLAALALTEHHDHDSVVDRDQLPADAAKQNGTPAPAAALHAQGRRDDASRCPSRKAPRSGRSTATVQRGLPVFASSGPNGLVSGA